MILHGRKQGNGGTHEAGEATNSYGLLSRQGEELGGFFFVYRFVLSLRFLSFV
jgi:hypothetical protein